MAVKPSSELRIERLGPLPLVNHFCRRLGLDAALADFVPAQDRDTGLPYAKALGVLLRSIIVEREPIYRQQEVVETFAPGAFGVVVPALPGCTSGGAMRHCLLLFT